MKKYSENISKLYENIGYEKIESGKTYTTSKGDKITINEIYIDATNEIPEAYVDYKAEMTNGETVEEKNRFGVVIDIIRAK
jgi:hypothetical protein